MERMADSGGTADGAREWIGHPRGLFILFITEMWERFSYYGMRALLIFYLTKHWLFSDSEANLIYGAYTALVYIVPVLGGYLADRWLGQRKAVQFGAVLLTIGHGLMALEGNGGQADPGIGLFWLALSFIVVGSGFMKANISVIVGRLYKRTDGRRDAAYTIFYIGINLGAFIGTLVAGWLGETCGWRYGFGAAGIGMFVGLVVFILGRPLLLGRAEAPDPALIARRVAGIRFEWLLYGIGVAAVFGTWILVQNRAAIEDLLLVSAILLLSYILYVAATKLDTVQRHRIFAILFLLLLQPVFWGLFEQAGGSLNLFADRYVDRGGVPASVFQSVNPFFILTLGPLFAMLWTALARRRLEPSATAKFGLGLLLVGLSFLVLVFGARAVGIDTPTPVIFIFLIYFFQTAGELCLSPVGLSAMNRLAPVQMASLIMGAWFFATAGGNFVAGRIGAATGAQGGAVTGKALMLDVYAQIGWVAMLLGLGVLMVAPFVTRLMHLDLLSDEDDRRQP
jgi:POT family proton-dependent oligopeptide transporter